MPATRTVTVSITQMDYFLDITEWAIKAHTFLEKAGRGEAYHPKEPAALADDCPIIMDDSGLAA